MESCSGLGGPVFSPTAGAANTSSTAPIRSAATAGFRSAALTITISRERAPFGAPPIRQRLTRGPSRVRIAGPTMVATEMLRITTMQTVPASEASSDPGRMKSETIIESNSVLPANITVRPA